MTDKIKQTIFEVFLPTIQFFSRLKVPVRRLIRDIDCAGFEFLAEPGDILLTRKRLQASNLLIPGFWTHAALIKNSSTVIEATASGVHETRFRDFLLDKDFVEYLQPLFASPEEKKLAVARASEAIGRAYDWYFETDNKALYCAELIVVAYQSVNPGWQFLSSTIWGEPVYEPSLFEKNSDNWRVVLKSASVG